MGVEQHSEYDGGGVMPNTVYPKGTDALTASDKLRLQSITGQETDSRAPVDTQFWHGNLEHDYGIEEAALRARQQKVQDIRQQEQERYRESQY